MIQNRLSRTAALNSGSTYNFAVTQRPRKECTICFLLFARCYNVKYIRSNETDHLSGEKTTDPF